MPAHKMKMTAALKKARQREQRLWRELAKAPLGEAVGVVRPYGVGGGNSRGERHWTLQIPLIAWRFEGGPVREEELIVQKRTTERVVMATMRRLHDYQVVRMRVRLAEKNSFGAPRAQLEQILAKKRDAEMEGVAKAMQKPVRMKDRRFGVLTLNRASDTFEARTLWGRKKVSLTLEADGQRSPEGALVQARKLFEKQREWDAKALRRVSTEMYNVWRKFWKLEDERMLTKERFLAKLRLKSIWVDPAGGFSMWYVDGDLFGGHDVVVRARVGRGISEVTLAG